MDYFQSKNVYFYIYYSNSLKVMALDIFFKQGGSRKTSLACFRDHILLQSV